ncbi:uncharacterized protein F5891DRAFT_1186586 [Suillus fuscotomentosus]|uniref:Uncharacterized protein n=1 Tax=Suillus fuscotomentosus TaxID=1912939 RepID=A0AAD4EA95_9AGAM|nr:uncharacterized protein F5891DRAFT_1186586 [Suillus fuscotomentosus]KAG1902465.1 hypothetical protein F5891DRAFT_1186586 [Suillus fuscotomentosus]
MFFTSLSNQPAWTEEEVTMFELMGTDSFTSLLDDQAAGPSGFTQGFPGQVPPFGLHHGSHAAPQASLMVPPSTNVILPTPLKDTNPGSTLGPSRQLDLSHYLPDASTHEQFPEEGASHSKEPLVVGRRSAESNATLDVGFAAVEHTLLELSRSTVILMHQVINLFMNSCGCNASSVNYWNLYFNYFKDKSQQELDRLHQDLLAGGHTPSVTVCKECYTKFKEQYPDTYQDILDMHDEISLLSGLPQTVGQCAQAFQWFQKRVTDILYLASAKFGYVHTTPGATDFFLSRCRADSDTIIGHLKAQVYNSTSLSTIELVFMEQEDDVASSSKVVDSKQPDSKDPDPDDLDLGSDPLEGREDSIKWIKKQITKQVAKFGGKFGTDRTFPWKLMPNALADDNICIKGYPAHKCLLPGESHGVISSAKSKGVASLTQKEVTIIIEALKVKTMYVKKVDVALRGEVLCSERPVIFSEAPLSDYPHSGARYLFINGHMDYNGLSRIKVSGVATKVKKSITLAGKSIMIFDISPPLPSRPFKVVPRPLAREMIEVRSTSPDSLDANDQCQQDSELEYEDVSHGKRKKLKSSGELRASKMCASPIDIFQKTAKTGAQSMETSVLSQLAKKGGALSQVTVGSSSDDQDPPTTTTMCLRDGPSNQPANTKVAKGSHTKLISRHGRDLYTIFSDNDLDMVGNTDTKSQNIAPSSVDGPETSPAGGPGDTLKEGGAALETTTAHLQSPSTSVPVLLGQGISLPVDLSAVPLAGGRGEGGGGGLVSRGALDDGLTGHDLPKSDNLPMDTDHRFDESVHPCESEVSDPREPIHPDSHDHVCPDPRNHVHPDPHNHVCPDPRNHVHPDPCDYVHQDPRDHVRPDPHDHIHPDPCDHTHHDYINAPFSGSHGHLLSNPRGPTHWDAPHPLDHCGPLPNPRECLSQEPHDLCVLGRSTCESSYPPQDYHHLCPHDSFYHRTSNAHDDLPELQETRGSM